MVALALVLVMVGALVGAAITAAALATARPKTSTPAATATGHLAAIFTVVGVGTTTLATVTPTNVPLTVRTTASTTYLRDGLAARFKDLRAGSRITMSGKQAADGSFTATHIVILDAALTGRITSVSRTGFVLTLSPKAVVTIVLTATTKIVKPPAEQPVSLSALKSGQTVSVYGVPAVSGSFQAVIVAIRV